MGGPVDGNGDESVAVSADSVLGGRVRLSQPEAGFRAAIDPVLLAATVAAGPGERVLDVGCGVGTAALCVAARLADVCVVGIDLQRDLVALAAANARANGLSARAEFMVGDLLAPPLRLAPGSFDHVIANPPFDPPARVRPSPDRGRALASVEGEAGLAQWAGFCARMAGAKADVTVIHRADRLDELLAAMRPLMGELVVFPLWPGPAAKPAKRVIVRGRKGVATPLRLAPGLVLHEAGGAYTAAAQAILRDAAALVL